MILVKAPLRISFLGGGTDHPNFYRQYPGRVISATIDKYVYVAINRPSLIDKISVRYSRTETVDRPDELQHPLFREALLDFGIHKNIEIGFFASVPAKTGLGSSSSFSVALMKGLAAYRGQKISKHQAAAAACRLEIDLVKDPIGKQDQYAASFGGFNIIQFNPDDSVTVDPVLADFKKRLLLQNHMLLFFTGATRGSADIWSDQQSRINDHIETYKSMADSVFEFKERLFASDMRGIADMLHEGWERKKSLSGTIANSLIDDMYEEGLRAGAWGGKILGAGGGGCLLLIAPVVAHQEIRSAMQRMARTNEANGLQEIPVQFVESGTEIMLNQMHTYLD